MIRTFLRLRVRSTAAAAALAATAAAAGAPGDDVMPVFRFDPQVPELPADGTPAFETTVVLGGGPVTLALELRSVRSADFRLVVQDERGERELVPPPPRTYRGTVRGVADSRVAATVVEGALSALVAMPDGAVYGVQPASTLLPGAAAPLHFAFDVADVAPDGGTCDADRLGAVFEDEPIEAPAGGDDDPLGQAGEKIAQLAFDADFEFFQQNGSSVAATVYDIERVVNGVGVIYRRDVDIEHFISFMIVRADSSDPYTATDPDALLCQFRDLWNIVYQNVTRDVAHLMTGRDLDGNTIGLAWRSVICNRVGLPDDTCTYSGNIGYGLSQSTSSVFARRVALTAHELGHNWGATHCDGDGDCEIMCSNVGGCAGGIDEFGARATAEILIHKSTRGCLITCDTSVAVPTESSTVAGGVYRACWGGAVNILGGSYDETIRINKACTLNAIGGSVIIGQ